MSSGEAEYYGLVKGSSTSLGVKSICQELGVQKRVRIRTDASAAKGIASRRGLGKVRHIEVNQLWVQDKVARGELEVVKISTHDNLADACTKSIESDNLSRHMEGVGMRVEIGRHELMPSV